MIETDGVTIHVGDARHVLAGLPDCIADCCITSPPFYRLRDYGIDGQIGMEETPDEYIEKLVAVFSEVRRVLKPEGTLWIEIGDTYAKKRLPGMKRKDMMGIPWELALALRADGWWLRQEIIWEKPNAMTESVTDRPSTGHSRIFMLARSEHYYYDHFAILEPHQPDGRKVTTVVAGEHSAQHRNGERWPGEGRNKRSVWTVPTGNLAESHDAAYPEELIEPCILAGSRPGNTVLDPFLGSGTTALAARRHGRYTIGIELNPEHAELAARRLRDPAALNRAVLASTSSAQLALEEQISR